MNETPELEPEIDRFEFSEHSLDTIERIADQIAFGERIVALANDESGGLGFVLTKAREGFMEGLRGFLNTDMGQPDALAKAIGFQSVMKRYQDLVTWVDEAAKAAGQAKAELKGMRRNAGVLGSEELTEEQKRFYGTEPTE